MKANLLKKLVYSNLNLLFFLGWVVTLIGLSLVQDWCKDKEDVWTLGGTLLADEVGDDCKKFFRFPWWVWALNTVPAVLAVLAVVQPDLARGATTAFFAALAPLNMILTDTFFKLSDSDNPLVTSSAERKLNTTVAGFAIMSAMALLMLLMDSVLVEKKAQAVTTGGAGGTKPAAPEAVQHV